MSNMEDKALEYCIEVYEQYTRAEINNFHGSIVRCWKTGKRAKKLQVCCECVAERIAGLEKLPKNKRFYRESAGFISR